MALSGYVFVSLCAGGVLSSLSLCIYAIHNTHAHEYMQLDTRTIFHREREREGYMYIYIYIYNIYIYIHYNYMCISKIYIHAVNLSYMLSICQSAHQW